MNLALKHQQRTHSSMRESPHLQAAPGPLLFSTDSLGLSQRLDFQVARIPGTPLTAKANGHGAGTLGKTLPRARLLRVFGTLPGNPQSPSSVMAWEVGFRHCSNENYEKGFGIKIHKKPHDPSSTQELVRCLIAMLDAEQRGAEQHEQRGLDIGGVGGFSDKTMKCGGHLIGAGDRDRLVSPLRHADLALRLYIPDNLGQGWAGTLGWTSVGPIKTQYYPGGPKREGWLQSKFAARQKGKEKPETRLVQDGGVVNHYLRKVWASIGNVELESRNSYSYLINELGPETPTANTLKYAGVATPPSRARPTPLQSEAVKYATVTNDSIFKPESLAPGGAITSS
eukprot:g31504.t1